MFAYGSGLAEGETIVFYLFGMRLTERYSCEFCKTSAMISDLDAPMLIASLAKWIERHVRSTYAQNALRLVFLSTCWKSSLHHDSLTTVACEQSVLLPLLLL